MTEHEPIPFLDLVRPHRELEVELLEVVREVVRAAGFIGGRMVEEFESAFANFCTTRYCVGVGSGTDALRFSLIAAGIGAGDAVVTVPNTFIATAEAISQAGALPEFVDVDGHTYNMDTAALRDYVENRCSVDQTTRELISHRSGKRVRAILPVHLNGQMAEMDPILDLAACYNLKVVEDACQAHGAEYFSKKQNRWCKAGSMGVSAAFSFYPGKNLGACGEAGAVTTNDEELAQKVCMLRDHGQAKKYHHEFEGYNGRLDAIQAGMLRVKLNHLQEWNQQRQAAAERYRKLFAATRAPVLLPYEPAWSRAVYHLYAIRCAGRDIVREALADCAIGTGIHYPIPLHLQTAYIGLAYKKGDFPIAEQLSQELLSLPMFPTLTIQQQRTVAETLAHFLNQTTARIAINTAFA